MRRGGGGVSFDEIYKEKVWLDGWKEERGKDGWMSGVKWAVYHEGADRRRRRGPRCPVMISEGPRFGWMDGWIGRKKRMLVILMIPHTHTHTHPYT